MASSGGPSIGMWFTIHLLIDENVAGLIVCMKFKFLSNNSNLLMVVLVELSRYSLPYFMFVWTRLLELMTKIG